MIDQIVGVVSILFGFLLMAIGAFFALSGMSADANATTIMHQVYGAIQFLTAAVLVGSGAILARLGTMRLSASVSVPPNSEANSALQDIAADVAWFKDHKNKEIVRAKAAAEQQKRTQQA